MLVRMLLINIRDTLSYCQYRVMPQLPEYDGEGDNNKSDDDGDEPCL